MTEETQHACPMCEKPAAPRTEKWYPFCSARCQLVDLGHWLDESYRIADSNPDES